MHRLTKAAISTAAALGIGLAVVPVALADGWGDVHCGQTGNPSCDVDAGRNGGKAPPPPAGPGKPAKPQTVPGQRPPSGDSLLEDNDSMAKCSYVRSNYQPPANGVQTVALRTGPKPTFARWSGFLAQQPQGGAWYVYRCSGSGVHDGLYRAPIWLPDGVVPAAALPSPQELADQARAQLRLPAPRIEANPLAEKLVNLPTWLWVGRDSWGTRQATASVPGVSVTAVATPTSVSWSMGDRQNVSCSGPGTPYSAAAEPTAASPDCGHTYRRSSAAVAGQHFAVTATVHWTVTWSGAGAGGTFPDMTTSATAAFRVVEVQALGTGRR
ncbi:hypothetical protein ACWED2_09895 [Amycolatopsis sp. NPDC005003]